MSLESDGGMILTGENRRTRRKTCPSGPLSTTNPTWIDPGHRGERPATNRLNHGTAREDNNLVCAVIDSSRMSHGRSSSSFTYHGAARVLQ
jgi:hypothetical protein